MDNISDTTFKNIANFLYEKTGITLKEYKKYLVINRLAKYVGNDKDYKTYEDFYAALLNDKTGELFTLFTNALTTNFSFFFREEDSFKILSNYLTKYHDEQKYIRLWSAASSTGEEAYSMAITVSETLKNINLYDIKILATDISDRVLKIAQMGQYKSDKILNHIPQNYMKKYFKTSGDTCEVTNDLKKFVTFCKLNLLAHYPFRKMFDVVFLRNVLIYFDEPKKEHIINSIFNYIKPNGLLIVGLSESLVGIKHPFKQLKNSIYYKPSPGSPPPDIGISKKSQQSI